MITPVTPEQLAEARRALGCNLAVRREAAGLTQAQLAGLSGYSRSAVANVETGRGVTQLESRQRQRELRAAWKQAPDGVAERAPPRHARPAAANSLNRTILRREQEWEPQPAPLL